MSDSMIGHNNPPAPTPFDASSEIVDGLFLEAKNWLDGSGVKTDDDAAAIAKLLEMLRQAEKDADAHRKAEKQPHDDASKAVQAKWKPLLDRCALAASACKTALTPFLKEKERKQRQEAEEARLAAETAERAAQEAFARSSVADLDMREQAEQAMAAATAAHKEAARADRQKAHARGGARAIGLRTSYRAEVTDEGAFARFVWQNHRQDLSDFLAGIAQRLVNAKQRDIPGVTIHEEKEAA